MDILINDQPHAVPPGATLADALAHVAPTPPFAAAVNAVFVPRSAYAVHALRPGDRVEVIRPVTGG